MAGEMELVRGKDYEQRKGLNPDQEILVCLRCSSWSETLDVRSRFKKARSALKAILKLQEHYKNKHPEIYRMRYPTQDDGKQGRTKR